MIVAVQPIQTANVVVLKDCNTVVLKYCDICMTVHIVRGCYRAVSIDMLSYIVVPLNC